jgi:hypothetical protein
LAKGRHIVAHGLGLKGHTLITYRTARLAAQLVATLQPAPDLVFFCLDTQGNQAVAQEMQDGLERASIDGVPITLAVMHQEVEAWVVAGFVPENNEETSVVRRLESEHAFDPMAKPHLLTPNRPTDPHDAKRVCKELFPKGTLSDRAQRCWLDTSLEELERRGAQTGLPAYLADVAKVVLPALGAPPLRKLAATRGGRRGASLSIFVAALVAALCAHVDTERSVASCAPCAQKRRRIDDDVLALDHTGHGHLDAVDGRQDLHLAGLEPPRAFDPDPAHAGLRHHGARRHERNALLARAKRHLGALPGGEGAVGVGNLDDEHDEAIGGGEWGTAPHRSAAPHPASAYLASLARGRRADA